MLLRRCKEATQTSLKAKAAGGLSDMASEDTSRQVKVRSDQTKGQESRSDKLRRGWLKKGHVGYLGGYGDAS